jgi:hypothetical protein
VRISRHSHPRARPEAAPVPPSATGIDYLGLVARRHAEELARAINYSDLAVPDIPDEPDQNELVAREADDGEAVAL